MFVPIITTQRFVPTFVLVLDDELVNGFAHDNFEYSNVNCECQIKKKKYDFAPDHE